MTDIPIYNNKGVQVDSLYINDTIEYVNGRVNKGDKAYYKGSGVPYKSHNVLNEDLTDEYEVLNETLIFYSGSMVKKDCFIGKTGIFQERYGCVFPDWIGTCGIRETQILENLYDEHRFEFNDIDVERWDWIDEEAGQIYLTCQYKSGRTSWFDTQDNYGLADLLNYMCQSGWNFPWDKAAIMDVAGNSLVTDVADIFYSRTLQSQLGSVYSILYSLGSCEPEIYRKFCIAHALPCGSLMDYITASMMILMRNNIDVSELMVGDPVTIYKNAVQNYLILGKNCGYCGVGSCKNREDDNLSYGDQIKEQYIFRTEAMLNK